jgi:hypothetical protein
MNVASARPIRQPCGKVESHRPRNTGHCTSRVLPAGAGEKGIARLAVHVTYGTVQLALVVEPPTASLPYHSPESRRRVPGAIQTRCRPESAKKGIPFVSLSGPSEDNARREWCASSASLRDTNATKGKCNTVLKVLNQSNNLINHIIDIHHSVNKRADVFKQAGPSSVG